MYREVYEIDENGFIIEVYAVEFDVEGNPVRDLPEGVIITTALPQPNFYLPRWVNGRWEEGATPEEIEELIKPEYRPPSLGEQLAERDSQIEYLKRKLLLTGQLVEYNSAQQQELLEILIEKGLI